MNIEKLLCELNQFISKMEKVNPPIKEYLDFEVLEQILDTIDITLSSKKQLTDFYRKQKSYMANEIGNLHGKLSLAQSESSELKKRISELENSVDQILKLIDREVCSSNEIHPVPRRLSIHRKTNSGAIFYDPLAPAFITFY